MEEYYYYLTCVFLLFYFFFCATLVIYLCRLLLQIDVSKSLHHDSDEIKEEATEPLAVDVFRTWNSPNAQFDSNLTAKDDHKRCEALENRLKQVLEEDLLHEWQQIQFAYANRSKGCEEVNRLKQHLIKRLDKQLRSRFELSRRKTTEKQLLNELLVNGKYSQHKLSQHLHNLLIKQMIRMQNEPFSVNEMSSNSTVRTMDRPDDGDLDSDQVSFKIDCNAFGSEFNLNNHSTFVDRTTQCQKQLERTCKERQEEATKSIPSDLPKLKEKYKQMRSIDHFLNVDQYAQSLSNKSKLSAKRRHPLSLFFRQLIVNLLPIQTTTTTTKRFRF